MRSRFEVKRPINAETESVSPTNFKLGWWLVHALSTAMAYEVGLAYCTTRYAGRTRDGHTTFSVQPATLMLSGSESESEISGREFVKARARTNWPLYSYNV